MSLLWKDVLIFGVANERSIAWGITQAFQEHGATIGLSYAGEVLERRVRPLAESIDCTFVEPCDVTSDEQIQALVDRAVDRFGTIDILVHAIAFAGRELLTGPYYNTTREGFHNTMDISVFSSCPGALSSPT
jgi:enoyl-[acyl-carrier protein] reductase I